MISAEAGAPEGIYTIPFMARSGPLSAEAEITLLVGDARIFLPEVSR
ncbi:MAG: hypothetical protein HY328_13990 [Chloroflexi bacterium]|nr:hypothetical protein [Chloroflexota bacterium]